MIRSLLPAFLFVAGVSAEEPAKLTFADADARLRRVYGLARETNDRGRVDRVLAIRDRVQKAFERDDLSAAELLIRDAEEVVGLKDGGRKMLGLPVARIDAQLEKALPPANADLAKAMADGDADAVAKAVAKLAAILGDQAGLPDVRREGDRTKAEASTPADVADLFLALLQRESAGYKSLASGKPDGLTIPRAYAAIVTACLTIRPAVERHQPGKRALVDDLVRGCCESMRAMQHKDGFFKFPDLRGRHLLFGEMIERLLEQKPDAVEEGWVVVASPDGGSQFDAGECGLALLEAGRSYKNDDWTKAGLRAADWVESVAPVPNFNHNAFSVSLLAQAHRATRDDRYAKAAARKFALGVAPGQSKAGRWLDPHNARTVYHVILLRCCHDVVECLPPAMHGDAARIARRAVAALVDEADALGTPATSLTVRELERHTRLIADVDKRVRPTLEAAASAVVHKCNATGKPRAAAPLTEIAAVSLVWPAK